MKSDEANRSISHNKLNRSDRDKGGGLTPSKNSTSPIRAKKEILNSYPFSNF